MDPQFESWQNAFKQATPAVDASKLLAQITAAKHKEQLKAYAELLLGIAVSIYCCYVALCLASNTGQTVLFATLAPVPVLFSLWSFRLRHRHWQQQTLDMQAFLAFKRDKLTLQLKYWRVSAWLASLLYSALAVIAAISYWLDGSMFVWLVQLGINGIILALVLLRYHQLTRKLPAKLAAIERIACS
jgi:hypothetical protein